MYKRNTERGPGSNQHKDKPPLPPSTQEKKNIAGKSKHAQEALFSLTSEKQKIDVHAIDIDKYVNTDSGLTPERWENEFVAATTSFLTGKSGMEGKLFGLMQYVPQGARYPEEVTSPLASKLRSEGLFSYDLPDPEQDDNKIVDLAFGRAQATKRYTKAYDEETQVLIGIEKTKNIFEQLKTVSDLLDSKNPNATKIQETLERISGSLGEVDSMGVGDSRSRSHLKSSVKLMENEMKGVGFDQRNMSERVGSSIKHSTKVFKQANGFYVMKAPEWMKAIHERSFFFFRLGNFEKTGNHFKEIADMASRGCDCSANLPHRESSSAKKRMNKIRKQATELENTVRQCSNGDLDSVQNLQGAFTSFTGTLGL